MPTTYTLINQSVITSNTASVNFASIPATFTDLVLKLSVRMNQGNNTLNYFINFNNVTTGSEYSTGMSYYNGSTVTTGAFSNDNGVRQTQAANGTASSSNSFACGEFYIPNYAGSVNKQIEGNTATSNNGTANLGIQSSQWRNTAINRITISGAVDFLPNSSFYLYGISNA